MKVHLIIITPLLNSNGAHRSNSRGPLYSASYIGEPIVAKSTQPCFDACRILNSRGLTGEIELWDRILLHPRFRIAIAKGAELTIEEGNRRPRCVKFKTFDGRDALQAFSVARRTHTALEKKRRAETPSPPVEGGAA